MVRFFMEGITSFWARIYFNVCWFFTFIARALGTTVYLPGQKRSVMEALNGPAEFRITKMADAVITVFCMFFVSATITLIDAMMGFKLVALLKNVYVSFGFYLIPTAIINYFLLWRKNKYLHYFREFDKEPVSEKRKWAWISLGTLMGIILLLVLSFEVSSTKRQVETWRERIKDIPLDSTKHVLRRR